MITRWFAKNAIGGVCLVFVGSLVPCFAQPPKADTLREQFEAVLDNAELSRLDQVRQLRNLIDREETTLLEQAVTEWIKQLGGTEFASREAAQKNLIEAGPIAIVAVTRGAMQVDRERAERCLSVLKSLAKGDEGAAAASAMEALQGLSKVESPIGKRAAQTVAELNETDQDRALAALAAVEARVHKNDTGDVIMISASRGGFSDREMRLLAAFPRLTMLTAFGEGVSDAGLDGLAEVKGLRHLSLLRTSITDVGLAKLSALPKLEFLTLGGAKVTANGLRKLKDSPSLQHLGLYEFTLSDAVVEELNALNIRGLHLQLKNTSDQDLNSIAKLLKLTYLTIMDSPNLTDEGLATISQLPLQSLDIPASKITNEGLRHVGNITSLSSLSLTGELITDDGLEHLNGLKNLRYISLRSTGVTDAGAAKLQVALPSLRNVYR